MLCIFCKQTTSNYLKVEDFCIKDQQISMNSISFESKLEQSTLIKNQKKLSKLNLKKLQNFEEILKKFKKFLKKVLRISKSFKNFLINNIIKNSKKCLTQP
jgi:hypothetical protein